MTTLRTRRVKGEGSKRRDQRETPVSIPRPIIEESKMIEIKCNHCGAVVAETELTYAEQNPNGLDAWTEQLSRDCCVDAS